MQKVRVARVIELSDGTVVNAQNCVAHFCVLFSRLEEEKAAAPQGENASGEKELTDKEKDVKKCMLLVASTLANILANKVSLCPRLNQHLTYE